MKSINLFFCFSVFLLFSQISNAITCFNGTGNTNQDDYNLTLTLSNFGTIFYGDSLSAVIQTSWVFSSRTGSGNYPITLSVYLDNSLLRSVNMPTGTGSVSIPLTPNPTVGPHTIRVVTNQVDKCEVTLSFEVRDALIPPTGAITGEIEGVASNGKVWGWACKNGDNKSLSPSLFLGFPNLIGPSPWQRTVKANRASSAARIKYCNSTGNSFNFETSFTASEMKLFCNEPVSGTVNGIILKNSGGFRVPCSTPQPINKGVIQSVSGGVLSGWACINGINLSVDVEIYAGFPDRLLGNPSIATVVANSASDSSVSASCGTFGVTHGVHYVFSSAEKQLYCGKALYVIPRNFNIINGVIGDSTALAGSGTFNIPCN